LGLFLAALSRSGPLSLSPGPGVYLLGVDVRSAAATMTGSVFM